MTTRNTINIIFIIVKQFFVVAFNSTFNLPNMNNVITSIDINVPCKGNGTSLGLTNGTVNFALGTTSYRTYPSTSAYGTTTGTGTGSSSDTGEKSYGITTDSSKSGIVGTITRTQINCNYVIKY